MSNMSNIFFNHIVDDTFYSPTYNGMVRVDFESRLWVDNRHTYTLTEYDSDIIQTLFYEWVSDGKSNNLLKNT